MRIAGALRKTALVSATAVYDATVLAGKFTQVIVKSDDGTAAANGNSAVEVIYLGPDGVTTGTGFPLRKGEAVSFDLHRDGDHVLEGLFCIASAADQVLSLLQMVD